MSNWIYLNAKEFKILCIIQNNCRIIYYLLAVVDIELILISGMIYYLIEYLLIWLTLDDRKYLNSW